MQGWDSSNDSRAAVRESESMGSAGDVVIRMVIGG